MTTSMHHTGNCFMQDTTAAFASAAATSFVLALTTLNSLLLGVSVLLAVFVLRRLAIILAHTRRLQPERA